MRLVRRVVGRALSAAALVTVLWWLAVVELGIRLLPLPRLSRLMGIYLESNPPDAGPPEGPGSRVPQLGRFRLRQLRMLGRVTPRWPFCDGACLREALVCGRIARRHSPLLRIGALSTGGGVEAHAWIEVAGHRFGGSPGDFVPLTRSGGAS